MTATALGFAVGTVKLAEDLRSCPAGDLQIIIGDPVWNAAQRLQALQTCFDRGVDVIPFAPRHCVSPTSASDYAEKHRADLWAALARIAGRGQLHLRLAKPTLPARGTDGRDWLLQRQAHHAALAARRDWLQALLATLQAPATPVQDRPEAMVADLLVPRGDLSEAIAQVTCLARQMQPAEGPPLQLSGLWPAGAFAATEIEPMT